ncbi:MAG TPA: glycosyltransferase family 2 protein [Candidatus Saccharimonadia bacterium]|jgi:cellulose synthase/poly-beta-1,6-N-acetylglucosamine synthase-like glycosyltransferase
MSTTILAQLVILFGIVNLIRIVLYMVGADMHDIEHADRIRKATAGLSVVPSRPRVSVIIPAYNEERVIIRALASVYANDYPFKEVVVVDDGSNDRTSELVRNWAKQHQPRNFRLIRKANAGKAMAINRGVTETTGSIIMVLDADSVLHPEALTNLIPYFQDSAVAMTASNVKIMDASSPLKLAQKFEYLICYRMKRAQTTFNIEYIIGGIGSAFRRSTWELVGGFDSDTVTEDIDFTMKVLRLGSKVHKVIYAPRVITYTEPVQNVSQLVKQRYRWKYGRSQVFLKNWRMFGSLERSHDKRLTLLALPYALFADLAFFFEPLITGFILYIIVRYHDWLTLLAAYFVLTLYVLLNLIAEETESWQSKLRLAPFALLQYPLQFALSFAEYAALIKTWLKTKTILARAQEKTSWMHVERAGKELPDTQLHRLS